MAVTKENVRDILIKNGLLKENKDDRFLLRGNVAKTESLQSIINGIKEGLVVVAEYGVNNGFNEKTSVGTMKDMVGFLSKVANNVLTGKRSADEHAITECGKRIEAIMALRSNSEREQNIDKKFTLEISLRVADCIDSTIAAAGLYKKQLNSLTEGEYNSIKAFAGMGATSRDDFVSSRSDVLDNLIKSLSEIRADVAAVVDDSSTNALNFAEDIIDGICQIRTSIVFAYLNFKPDMMAPLKGLSDSAKNWRASVVGVTKNVKRASGAEVQKLSGSYICDQLSEYVKAAPADMKGTAV